MDSNRYQIFINQTLQLAQTIVIKSSQTAVSLNEWVFGNSGYLTPVSADPTTWKYYLNLAGEYHSFDQVMTVTSMDTQEEIIFNRGNLQIHRATARGYEYGTRQYTELLAKYPDQEQLILGILYPTDINQAIMAPDGAILSYPSGLVEGNEYSLMTKLQAWIDAYKLRWTVPAFDLTDELYTATNLGIMYLMIVPALLNLRLAACNTNEAHSFHVRQYLGSHGYLDAYIDALSTKQALYFYRNIAFIERNAGKRSTFSSLTDHIMSERFIPLAEYTMRHDLSDQPENDYPTVVFRKKQLNLGIRLDPQNQISLNEMLVKQIDLAPSNGDDLPAVEQSIQTLMENSASNVVATKTLESTMEDESNSSPWILGEILFNHWLYWSSKDLYVSYISINNPKSGEQIPLTAKEAFIFALYVFSRSVGITPAVIPSMRAARVQRIRSVQDPNALNVDDIYSVVDHKLIDRSIAMQALSLQPTLTTAISTDAFYSFGVAIYNAVQMQRGLIAQQEHQGRRAQVHSMVSRIYHDPDIDLAAPDTPYAGWLSERNIDVTTFTVDDFKGMFDDVVSQATGASLHPIVSMQEMQAAMVGMFTQLSSYGIQIIAEINDTNIRKTDWPGVRPGELTNSLEALYQDADLDVNVIHNESLLMQRVICDINNFGVDAKIIAEYSNNLTSDITLQTTAGKSPVVWSMTVLVPKINVTSHLPLPTDVPRGITVQPGIVEYLSLPLAQQQKFKDIYNNYLGELNGDISLTALIKITELLPFDLGEEAEALERSIINTVLGKTYPE